MTTDQKGLLLRFPTERRMAKYEAPEKVKRIIVQNPIGSTQSRNMLRALWAVNHLRTVGQ